MFSKQGIPFFIIIIPFSCLLFSSFFATSFYLKLSNESFEINLIEYKNLTKSSVHIIDIKKNIKNKKIEHNNNQEKFINFMIILTICLFIFLSIFTAMMSSIISDIVKKYILKVEVKEHSLEDLNKTLQCKVKAGIKEGKRKDKAMLQQSKLASLGSMINMIAHQWRQPLSELSGILMELEIATKFKKVDEKHIFSSIKKSDKTIEFMSNTIDDFRNFYKPDKTKELFHISTACEKAILLVNAALKNTKIELKVDIIEDEKILGYPREYSQVILNLISNAKDVLLEREIKNPRINIMINSNKEKSLVLIKDNANGINEDVIDMIFDPYFSTKSFSNGSGLGLYISKLIIEENMNGILSVENGENGAIFKIEV